MAPPDQSAAIIAAAFGPTSAKRFSTDDIAGSGRISRAVAKHRTPIGIRALDALLPALSGIWLFHPPDTFLRPPDVVERATHLQQGEKG